MKSLLHFNTRTEHLPFEQKGTAFNAERVYRKFVSPIRSIDGYFQTGTESDRIQFRLKTDTVKRVWIGQVQGVPEFSMHITELMNPDKTYSYAVRAAFAGGRK